MSAIVHVCDPGQPGIIRDFTCNVGTLTDGMRYFRDFVYRAAHARTNPIEISVQCDVAVFEWLLGYCHGQYSREHVTVERVLALLIASNFLQMDALVSDCLAFIAEHLVEVALAVAGAQQQPGQQGGRGGDLTALPQELLARLAKMVPERVLERLAALAGVEGHGRLMPLVHRLYKYKLEGCLRDLRTTVARCAVCQGLFSLADRAKLECPGPPSQRPQSALGGGKSGEGLGGRSWAAQASRRAPGTAVHIPDATWRLQDHLATLRAQHIGWRGIYWHMWGFAHVMYCHCCMQYVPAVDLRRCTFHPQPPVFAGTATSVAAAAGRSATSGFFPCCGAFASRGTDPRAAAASGCCAREHRVLPSGHAAGAPLPPGLTPALLDTLRHCSDLFTSPGQLMVREQPLPPAQAEGAADVAGAGAEAGGAGRGHEGLSPGRSSAAFPGGADAGGRLVPPTIQAVLNAAAAAAASAVQKRKEATTLGSVTAAAAATALGFELGGKQSGLTELGPQTGPGPPGPGPPQPKSQRQLFAEAEHRKSVDKGPSPQAAQQSQHTSIACASGASGDLAVTGDPRLDARIIAEAVVRRLTRSSGGGGGAIARRSEGDGIGSIVDAVQQPGKPHVAADHASSHVSMATLQQNAQEAAPASAACDGAAVTAMGAEVGVLADDKPTTGGLDANVVSDSPRQGDTASPSKPSPRHNHRSPRLQQQQSSSPPLVLRPTLTSSARAVGGGGGASSVADGAHRLRNALSAVATGSIQAPAPPPPFSQGPTDLASLTQELQALAAMLSLEGAPLPSAATERAATETQPAPPLRRASSTPPNVADLVGGDQPRVKEATRPQQELPKPGKLPPPLGAEPAPVQRGAKCELRPPRPDGQTGSSGRRSQSAIAGIEASGASRNRDGGSGDAGKGPGGLGPAEGCDSPRAVAGDGLGRGRSNGGNAASASRWDDTPLHRSVSSALQRQRGQLLQGQEQQHPQRQKSAGRARAAAEGPGPVLGPSQRVGTVAAVQEHERRALIEQYKTQTVLSPRPNNVRMISITDLPGGTGDGCGEGSSGMRTAASMLATMAHKSSTAMPAPTIVRAATTSRAVRASDEGMAGAAAGANATGGCDLFTTALDDAGGPVLQPPAETAAAPVAEGRPQPYSRDRRLRMELLHEDDNYRMDMLVRHLLACRPSTRTAAARDPRHVRARSALAPAARSSSRGAAASRPASAAAALSSGRQSRPRSKSVSHLQRLQDIYVTAPAARQGPVRESGGGVCGAKGGFNEGGSGVRWGGGIDGHPGRPDSAQRLNGGAGGIMSVYDTGDFRSENVGRNTWVKSANAPVASAVLAADVRRSQLRPVSAPRTRRYT